MHLHFLRLIHVATLATVVMDVLAQTERMVGKNTFSQPLILIECIRRVLKGLGDVFLRIGVPRSTPKREGTCPLLARPRNFSQSLSLRCLHGKLDPVASCTLVMVFYTPILWRTVIHKLCIHTHTHLPHRPPLYRPCFWQTAS